jgi:hypothetical protein
MISRARVHADTREAMGSRDGLPLRDFGETNVRFGSKADIRPKKRDVRFTPESGHRNPVA